MVARLPPELLLPIVAFSVEGEPLRARYALLLAYCRVSRAFCGAAQPLLFEDARPASFSAWQSLFDAVRRVPALGRAVKRLSVPEEVETAGEQRVDNSDLHTLFVDSLRFDRPCTLPSLPTLQQLQLSLSLFLLNWLNPDEQDRFPHLRYLDLVGSGFNAPSSSRGLALVALPPSLRGVAAPIAAAENLEVLSFTCPVLWRISWQAFVDFMPPWRTLPASALLLQHLHVLPIRWTPPPHYLEELCRRLSTDPTLASLEVLYLPRQWEGVGTEEGRAEWERILLEQAVEVEYEDEGEGDLGGNGEGGHLLEAFMRRCEQSRIAEGDE